MAVPHGPVFAQYTEYLFFVPFIEVTKSDFLSPIVIRHCFSMSQVGFSLGIRGVSFTVGYGENHSRVGTEKHYRLGTLTGSTGSG
jgi:hypothetical protein